jgi:hypothetical protein
MPAQWTSQLLLLTVLGCSPWVGATSQELENCTETLQLAPPYLIIPTGIVCIQCVFNGTVAADAEFEIDGVPVDPNQGGVVNGTLVVPDSQSVFSSGASSTTSTLGCSSGGNSTLAMVFVESFEPPVITGETTVSEGDSLDLSCNGSNSVYQPAVHWVSPSGEVVSDSGHLYIVNITRNKTGVYTCVATDPHGSTATINSTAYITVQYAPEVISYPAGPLEISEGDTLQLSCLYEGVPSPYRVVWTLNSTQLNSSDPRVTINTAATVTSLTIAGVLSSEGGLYTCHTQSSVGTGSATTSVRVQAGRPVIEPVLFKATSVPGHGVCGNTSDARATINVEVRRILQEIVDNIFT